MLEPSRYLRNCVYILRLCACMCSRVLAFLCCACCGGIFMFYVPVFPRLCLHSVWCLPFPLLHLCVIFGHLCSFDVRPCCCIPRFVLRSDHHGVIDTDFYWIYKRNIDSDDHVHGGTVLWPSCSVLSVYYVLCLEMRGSSPHYQCF